MKIIILAILLAAGTSAFAGEAELLATLKSSTASRYEKSDACRQLAICATKASVPTLAALLTNDEMSHMARYALEPLKDPSVDEALRDALGKTTDRLRAGVIHSIGVRQDKKAVPALIKLLPDSFAASALARIGTPDALAALEKNLPATAAACLIAAGTKPELYEKLIAPSIPAHIRVGAMAGTIRNRGAKGVTSVVELLRNEDPGMFGVALRLTREWDEKKLTTALAGEISKLPADRQELLVRALGDRGDRAVVPALLTLRTAASIQVLTQLRETSAVPMLVEIALAGRELAPVAQAALVSMPGKEAEKAVLALLDNSDAKIRALGVSLVGQRRVAGAVPALLKATGDSDEAVRAAAIRAAGELAGAKEFPLLIGLLLKAKSSAEADPVETALTGVCTRESKPTAANITVVKAVYGDLPDGKSADVTAKVAKLLKAGTFTIEASNKNFGDPAGGKHKKLRIDYDAGSGVQSKTVAERDSIALSGIAVPPAMSDALCAAAPKASGPAKIALLRVLRAAGGAKGLGAIRAATSDSDTEVRETALRAMCDWPTAEALPDLANLAKTSSDAKFKILALRGWLRLVGAQDAPPEKKMASLKEASSLITRDDERQLLLSALGQVPSVDALTMALSFLGTPRLKETACVTIINISEKIVGTQPAAVAAALEKAEPKNRRTADRAKELLAQAKTAANK
jgi:HEAT repeat protein